jgi:preprotein translocase subunit SecG
MQNLLIVIELFVSVALIVVILLQRSEGGALGMGGGGGGLGGLFSPRGAADTLTRTTTILGVVFFLTCMGLTLFSLRGRNEGSFLDTNGPLPGPAQTAPQPKPLSPPSQQAPAVPTPH